MPGLRGQGFALHPFYFGAGRIPSLSDGDAIINTNTEIDPNVVFNYSNLTIESGAILSLRAPLFVSGVLDLGAGCTIEANGRNGSGFSIAYNGIAKSDGTGAFGGIFAGGSGGLGRTSAGDGLPATPQPPNVSATDQHYFATLGGAGGNGGGVTGAAGLASDSNYDLTAFPNPDSLIYDFEAMYRRAVISNKITAVNATSGFGHYTFQIACGAGGGGGASGGGQAGGGGGGGGHIWISCDTLRLGSGSKIQANGGNGGNASGAADGGGAGGGGIISIFCNEILLPFDNTAVFEVHAGSTGAGSGGGGGGSSGGSGTKVLFVGNAGTIRQGSGLDAFLAGTGP